MRVCHAEAQLNHSTDHCYLVAGYAPVRQNYEDFYTRRMYYRIHVGLQPDALEHLANTAACLQWGPPVCSLGTSRRLQQGVSALLMLSFAAGLLEQAHLQRPRCTHPGYGAHTCERPEVGIHPPSVLQRASVSKSYQRGYCSAHVTPQHEGAVACPAECWLCVHLSSADGQYAMHRALTLTGRVKECLNLGSYNYLGFAASDAYCTPRVLDTMSSLGWAMCSSRMDAGEPLHALPTSP